MKLLRFLIISLVVLGAFIANAATPISQLRGLRIDPSYFAIQYPNLSIDQIAKKVIDSAIVAGTNTIFLYAYSPLNGAFYPTDYPQTEIEPLMGSVNAFGIIAKYAKSKGLRVFAVLPLNDFHQVWQENPAWRSKIRTGGDSVSYTHLTLPTKA